MNIDDSITEVENAISDLPFSKVAIVYAFYDAICHGSGISHQRLVHGPALPQLAHRSFAVR